MSFDDGTVGGQEMYFRLADPRRHAVLVLAW
jgi:hypothetical protein